jgi:hypothetical protein
MNEVAAASTSDGPLEGWTFDQVELAHVLAFWEEAQGRDWVVAVDRHRVAWSVSSPDRARGGGYQSPGQVCTGLVEAHDDERTLTVTGVSSAVAAVDMLREFLGWPDGARSTVHVYGQQSLMDSSGGAA